MTNLGGKNKIIEDFVIQKMYVHNVLMKYQNVNKYNESVKQEFKREKKIFLKYC